MERVFITGGSGFIGRKLITILMENGYAVRALARSKRSSDVLRSLGAEVVKGSMSDQDSLEAGISDCIAVFHLAGLVSFKFVDRKKMFSVNVEGTRNILKAIEKHPVQKFIYCSSTAALGGSYGDILNEESPRDTSFATTYEKTKTVAHGEVVAAAKKIRGIVIAMPSFVMGPDGGDILGAYIKAFCKGLLPFLLKVNTPISYVFVNDVAQGLYLCLTKGRSGQQYILSSNSSTSLEVVALLEKYSHKRRPFLRISPAIAKPLLVLDELFETIVGKHPLMTVELLRKLEGKSWLYSGEKAKSELGWQPCSVEEMVQRTVEAI